MILKYWCTQFSAESDALREEMDRWTRCLSNRSPPWAAYRALMAGCLVTLDKSLGVCPVVIGKAIRRLMAELLQVITAHQAMEACDINNLFVGLKDGIEGEVHASEQAFGKNTPPKHSLVRHPTQGSDWY